MTTVTHERALIVEDGYAVLAAANGDEALALIAEQVARVSLVLSDVVMAGPRGTEPVAELARRRPDLPVVFRSGYADDDLRRRGVLAGHVAILQQPFASADPLATVRHHLLGKRPLG